MQLNKVKKSFNDYDLTLSWGQLEVIRGALEQNHSEPVADEMLAEFEWYMERVPGPGEEEEQVKQREEGGMPAEGGMPGEEGAMGVEQPPTEGGPVDMSGGPPAPPGEMPGGEQPPEGGTPEMAAPPEGGEPELEGGPVGETPTQEPLEADQHLPAPPEE